MNYCKECGAKSGNADAFCGKCGVRHDERNDGRQINISNERDRRIRPQVNHQARQVFIPAIKTAAGAAGFNKILEAHQKKFKTRLWSAGVCLLLAGTYFAAAHEAIGAGIGVVAAAAFFFAAINVGWSESDYYTVPGSLDATDGHRCIYCGHRGVHKRTEYKSNRVHADCPKCKEHLWSV